MASDLNMDGNQISNGSPGVASTDFVVVSQLETLRQSILAEVGSGGGGGSVNPSLSAEQLLYAMLIRLGYRS